MIKTAVCGANGKVGKEVVEAVQLAEDTELVAKIDINNGEYVSVKDALEHTKIDVVVDFTQPKAIFENAKYCLNNGSVCNGNINVYSGCGNEIILYHCSYGVCLVAPPVYP